MTPNVRLHPVPTAVRTRPGRGHRPAAPARRGRPPCASAWTSFLSASSAPLLLDQLFFRAAVLRLPEGGRPLHDERVRLALHPLPVPRVPGRPEDRPRRHRARSSFLLRLLASAAHPPPACEQWHQGGPGGSSINVGLYTEMGYFQVDSEGTHTNDYVRATRSPPAAFARRSKRGACAGVEQSREHAVPRVSRRLRLSQRLLHLRQGRARRRLRVDRPVPGRGLRPHPRLFLRAGERESLF